jgi:hypothetical protein
VLDEGSQNHEDPEQKQKLDSTRIEYQKQFQNYFCGATGSVLFKGRYLEVT